MRFSALMRLTALSSLALLTACSTPPAKPDKAPISKPNISQPAKPVAEPSLAEKARAGDLESQFQLGSGYFVGQPDKDLKQAEYWWKQAADKGHAMATVSLAYLYTGRNAPEFANQPQMLRYLNQSASAGNAMAQHILGSLYLRGQGGVPRDPDQANRLYQSACNQGYEVSCSALGKQ